jgi:tetratricopeptide (TPR) repeat protein
MSILLGSWMPRSGSPPALLLVCLLSLLLPAWAPAQSLIRRGQDAGMAAAPPAYEQAMALLAVGDTAAAIDRLRETTRHNPRYGPAFLRLGSLLSRQAAELEVEYSTRLEAERALQQAYRLMGDQPEVLLERGLLLHRQDIRVDAERVLNRAWDAARRRGGELEPGFLAELHFTLGKVYETWWEAGMKLAVLPPFSAIICPELTGAASYEDAAVICPGAWAEQLEHYVSLANRKNPEWFHMMNHFRLTLAADPGHVDAAVRLLGHLADAADWEEYQLLVRRLTLVANGGVAPPPTARSAAHWPCCRRRTPGCSST